MRERAPIIYNTHLVLASDASKLSLATQVDLTHRVDVEKQGRAGRQNSRGRGTQAP